MNKKDLIRQTAKNAGINQDTTRKVVDAFLKTIKENLKKEENITISEFGKFYNKHFKGRTVKSINTGKEINVPPYSKPAFKPSPNIYSDLS